MKNVLNGIRTSQVKYTVIDPFQKIPFEDADFDQIVPLGEGTQGIVYAVAIHIEGDPTEYRYVVKRLRKVRTLGSASISCSPSAGTYGTMTPNSVHFSFGARSVASAISRQRMKKRGPSFDSHIEITRDSNDITDHNIIKLIKIIEHNGEEYALLPYCDLFLDTFMNQQFKSLDETQRIILSCEILIDVLEALSYLNYTKDYAHRDIKPENIALCGGKWCIVDFECAISVGQKVKGTSGSPYYMHPWCFIDSDKSTLPGNDLYAIGVVLNQLLDLPPMFHSTNYYQLVDEKIAIHKANLVTKWGNGKAESLFVDMTPFGRLRHLSEQMCGLMSDQPSIDSIINEIRMIYSSVSKSPLSPLSEIYDYSRSDGYFSSMHDKTTAFMEQVPLTLERRRSSWGGIIKLPHQSDTDMSDEGDISSCSYPYSCDQNAF